MKTLNKKYRLQWNENLTIKGNPFQVYGELSETNIGDNANTFESDDIEAIKNKIIELELINENI